MIPSEYELAHNDPERDSLERLEREWAAEDATPGGVDEVRCDGLVFRNPCVECGDVCQGHGGFLRDADGAALVLERSPCGHLVAEIDGREGGTRWCAGCVREARVRDEERAAIVAWLRGPLMAPSERALARSLAAAIERRGNRS